MLTATLEWIQIKWFSGSSSLASDSHPRSLHYHILLGKVSVQSFCSQEYYEEQSIRELYQSVLERLLLTLDEKTKKQSPRHSRVLVEGQNDQDIWPPWPWPPWDGDDGGDEDKRKPAERAHDLAKGVIKFESQIANASLDL
jgi:hypothetical protein